MGNTLNINTVVEYLNNNSKIFEQKMTKELNINGTVYALYEIDNGTLFLKTTKDIVECDPLQNESFIVAIIQKIEPENFRYIAYLNV